MNAESPQRGRGAQVRHGLRTQRKERSRGSTAAHRQPEHPERRGEGRTASGAPSVRVRAMRPDRHHHFQDGSREEVTTPGPRRLPSAQPSGRKWWAGRRKMRSHRLADPPTTGPGVEFSRAAGVGFQAREVTTPRWRFTRGVVSVSVSAWRGRSRTTRRPHSPRCHPRRAPARSCVHRPVAVAGEGRLRWRDAARDAARSATPPDQLHAAHRRDRPWPSFAPSTAPSTAPITSRSGCARRTWPTRLCRS